ncbi:VPGUxxT family thioredoxin-like (seleno)protein, type 2 [Nonlabens xiamenensis]|uniref:VPGUxxT family thioredoxin-like (seleno)protein, type 2 n=1 Tax=Nonlabens xiamenensis TaxID=2341043 RepID=UPI0013DDA38C|nr:VPGUxxT family thioredoxin-like (seleno)protein, type 2 [Nonlabens xiamenensis]
MRYYLVLLVGLITVTSAVGQTRTEPYKQPEELGRVSWWRNYEVALQESAATGKPILILFQEVPGCSTCKNYGKDVLSHPLMTEAIENEFIPLAIYNNRGGADREVLERFRESAWNNPVVQIVDPQGKPLIQRVAGNYTARGLYQAMRQVLEQQKRNIPLYFELLGQEIGALGNTEQATYQMYCFWTGEKELGSQKGVLQTEAGFSGGSEVVRVTYDTQMTNKLTLDKFAQQKSMKAVPEGSFKAAQQDEDYYLRRTDYARLPLSVVQRTKMNTALGQGKSAKQYLSPQQLKWLKVVDKAKTNLPQSSDFQKHWELWDRQ